MNMINWSSCKDRWRVEGGGHVPCLFGPSQTCDKHISSKQTQNTQKGKETGNKYHVSDMNVCKHSHTSTKLDVCEYYEL